LRKQFPLLQELLTTMGIAVCKQVGYEADDILGTFARRAERAGLSALLVTGDRDVLQLISEKTHVLMTKRGITDTVEYTESVLKEQYGLVPDRMRDLKGLMGDNSDNIPGIPGVGEKTALKLLDTYGSLNAVLEHAEEIKGKLGERVREHADKARLSYWLGTIDTDAPVDMQLADCTFSPNGLAAAADRLRELELRAVLSKIPQSAKAPQPTVETEAIEFIPVTAEEQLKEIVAAAMPIKRIALHLGEAFSFAFDENTSYCITAGETLFDVVLDMHCVWTALLPVLQDDFVEKLVFDGKSIRHHAASFGVEINNIAFDAMIADYLLNAIRPSATLQQTVEQHLQTAQPTAAHLFTLERLMLRLMEQQSLLDLYREMEMPLSNVLYNMEREGFFVDDAVLIAMQTRFEQRATELSAEIYEHAGETFNILSTKQLGTILFERLNLPPQRKTKSGYSTDAETLERLEKLHPIVPLIQEYRFITKLKSTFVDGLLAARSKEDGRVRTRFQQCITATGRISSTEPNLQNIPVRTALGREIRKAFVASEGNILVGADYSQIELRILAHLSEDVGMIRSFLSGEDIHRRTASEVFDVPLDAVTSEQRSAAKAVNFGIVYGISDFGLSQNLYIPVKQAHDYIARYFERYPGIEAFMKRCVEEGKTNGYAVTMFSRRRALPELKSSNFNTRSFGERVAMNMPIQGSAADIIKLAMVRAENTLRSKGLHAKLILQVHDELIFDTPMEEAEQVCELVRESMEQVFPMRVPLVADVRTGHSWFDTK